MKVTLGQLVLIIILLVLIGFGAFFGMRELKGDKGKTRQAVFLVNGQVYFGYVSNPQSKMVTLRDVYYLQVQQNLQQPAKADEQPKVSLVKLGNELHGPKDEMHINREQIVFIEDMKDDSKVNQAIADYIKNGAQATTPTPVPTK